MSFEYKIGKFLRKEILYPNISASSNLESLYSIEETLESQITNKIYSTKISYNEFTIETNIKDNDDFKEKFKILAEKEKIFLHCLLKISEEGKTSKKIFDCSNLEFEQEEMKFHEAIGRVVHQLMHNKIRLNNSCMYYQNINNSCKISHENIDKLINKEKTTNKKLEFIAIKSIIISISSFTSELIRNYFVYFYNRINTYKKGEDLNYIINCEIFSHMFDDYEDILNICTIIERDFSKSLNWFREKYQMSFDLNDLFTDIFWNAIFHNKQFCDGFLQNFNCETIDKNTQDIFDQIISILFEINIPLKRQISELLGIRNIVENDEKYDLLSLLISEKKLNNTLNLCDNIKECLNINNIINSKIKSSNQDKGIETFININEENINELTNFENIKYGYEKIKEDIKSIKNNIISKEKENDIKEIKKSKTTQTTTTLSNNSIPISNPIQSLNENNNISLENKTIDEIFDYINSDSNEKSKNKRKHKKKNKKIIEEPLEENNNNYELDPIVEQFKNELSITNTKNQKIKPVISSDWLTSITLKSY